MTSATVSHTKTDCSNSCSVKEEVVCDLRNRPAQKEIHLTSLTEFKDSDTLGYFADDSHYDHLISEDTDVYLNGTKALVFRKGLFKLFANKDQKAWEFFKWVAGCSLSDQRGLVAGKEITTKLDIRLTNGQINFLKAIKKGKQLTDDEAREMIKASPDKGKLMIRVRAVRDSGFVDAEAIKVTEAKTRKRNLSTVERENIEKERRALLDPWFDAWFEQVYVPAEDKVKVVAECNKIYVSQQIRANSLFSNILGAMDRSARVPFGRLSGPSQSKFAEYEKYKDIYRTACAALKETMNDPENPRWDSLYSRFGSIKDPRYNLFGTCFTTLTVNLSFRTAFHRDANNCEGGIAVLTALTRGDYSGHYLVFPELRVAFDLRDGDMLVGDNQAFIHGNTAMIPKSPDAERVSLVFYSRERMVMLDSDECEKCRKAFIEYASENHRDLGKDEKAWGGIFPGMWNSPEWMAYKKANGMEQCSNTNWWGTEA